MIICIIGIQINKLITKKCYKTEKNNINQQIIENLFVLKKY